MKYATGYCMNAVDVMKGFPAKKTVITAKECEKIMKNRHKEKLAERIWKANIAMVLDDVIDNSDTFVLPTASKKAEIYIKSYPREEFVQGRKNGKWKDIDYLASNFTGAQMMFKYQNGGVFKEKPIYVDAGRKQRIADRLNSGKAYY